MSIKSASCLVGAMLAVLLLGGTTTAFGQSITASKHDFSTGKAWNTTGQLCVVCHTPHNASATVKPLWNHALSAITNYTLYASSTLNAAPGQPISTTASGMCLGCHDGTVGLGNFGGVTTDVTYIAAGYSLATDLSNDHPVSFTYDAALVGLDSGLVLPASASKVDAAGLIPLYSAKLECASCHNPHDKTNTPFLRTPNAASALCLKCHIK